MTPNSADPALLQLLQDIGARIDALGAEIAALRRTLAQGGVPAPKPAVAPPAAPRPASPAAGPRPLNIALIGGGMHGAKSVKALLKLPDCRISHICDVDSKKGAARAAEIKSAAGYRPKVMTDFREALADPTLDGVVIVTPHHWHALAAIMAVQAGKHVYVEKPVTHCFDEGPALLAAARKYGKVVMPGTQLRSNRSLMAAGDYMREGRLGPISLVHCIIHKDRPALPMTNAAAVPESVNYDLWLGPRPDRALTRSKFHYHWHWFWDVGNGALGNNGIHRIDAARMALDLQGRGDAVLSIGGRFGKPDMSQTPNTQLCLYRYGQTWLLQDVLGVNPQPYRGMENAVVFHGTEGVIVYQAGNAVLCDTAFNPISTFDGKQESHYARYLQAIRDQAAEQTVPDLAEAIISSDLCHFGNISHRIGQPATDSQISALLDTLGVPALVHERFAAMRENIRAAGDGEAELTLGEMLTLQEGAVPFVNAPQAALDLLKFEDRAPFTYPAPDAV